MYRQQDFEASFELTKIRVLAGMRVRVHVGVYVHVSACACICVC